MKITAGKIINIILALLIIAGIAIPSVFTMVEMGVFYKEPEIETQITASDDAPVLRIATDYDFAPIHITTKKENCPDFI